MGAVRTSIAKLKAHERVVLVRNGSFFKGTLFEVAATPACDDAYWMLRGAKNGYAIALYDGDEIYTSSSTPCFACRPPGMFKAASCATCFDGFL